MNLRSGLDISLAIVIFSHLSMDIVKQAEAFKIAIENFTSEDIEQLKQILSTPDQYTLLDLPEDLVKELESLEASV
jgi:hypothetical protein